MSGASWLDVFFLKYRTIRNNGVDVPQRAVTNFIGLTVADDPVNDQTTITGSGGSSGAVTAGFGLTGGGTLPCTLDCDFGTSAGTVCEGNDSRLGGAVTAGSGLSGGGTLPCTIAVSFGSSGGSVCVGNDSRLSDSRAPNGSAGGSLGGTYPSPTVKQIDGTGGSASVTCAGVINTSDSKCSPGSVVATSLVLTGAGTSTLQAITLADGIWIITARIGAVKSDLSAGCTFIEVATFIANSGTLTQQDTTVQSYKSPSASSLACTIDGAGTDARVRVTNITGTYTWGGVVDFQRVHP